MYGRWMKHKTSAEAEVLCYNRGVKIYFGADHRGFNLKETLKRVAEEWGYKVEDLGNEHFEEDDDYPDFAIKVGKKVSLAPDKSRGVLICGSGVGVDIAANKFIGARSVLGISEAQVKSAREDDDVNVLSIAADFINREEAIKMLKVFLETDFKTEAKYRRRILKISEVEKNR